MLKEDRREKILAELAVSGSVQVTALAEQFQVTTETIRKDLAALEESGYLIKTHGGATLRRGSMELSFGARQQENSEAKTAIAQRAVTLVDAGASIILCTGSTTLRLAQLLALRSGLKIFTDSLPAALALIQSDNQVMLFGGRLREQSSSVCGGWTVSQIQQISADMCFMGSDGFANLTGPSTPSSSDAFVDRAVLQHVSRSYVLADHSKFVRRSLYKICDWEEVTALITNRQVDSSHADQVAKHTEIMLA